MATYISHNVEETQRLGVEWGRTLQTGMVIGLTGDLGAGKTQFVKGLAKGLGISGRIQSPTFAIINEHRSGRVPLYHIDLYRLDSREEIITAGLEPYLYRPDGISVVEWIDRWLLPEDKTFKYRRVNIKLLGETDRQIDYEDFGS